MLVLFTDLMENTFLTSGRDFCRSEYCDVCPIRETRLQRCIIYCMVLLKYSLIPFYIAGGRYVEDPEAGDARVVGVSEVGGGDVWARVRRGSRRDGFCGSRRT